MILSKSNKGARSSNHYVGGEKGKGIEARPWWRKGATLLATKRGRIEG